MNLRHVFVAIAFVLVFALHGAGEAAAGAAVAPSRAIALGGKLNALGAQNLIEVQRERRRSRRNRPRARARRFDGDRRRGRRHRRRDRGPSFRLYIGPPNIIYGPAYRQSGRCGYWRRRCIVRWRFGTPNYYDCMYYHGC